jgi:hypothetical protein
MLNFLKQEVNLAFLVNPFYIYCATFSLSIFIYLWGWSSLYPEFSFPLIFFLLSTFGFSLTIGKILSRYLNLDLHTELRSRKHFHIMDFLFFFIILLGVLDIYLTGYIPVINRTRNHLDFGFPVVDPIFSSLSIFFSVFFFQTFLESRKKRYILYFILIIVTQLLIFRRSTVIWILTASIFIFILNRKWIKKSVLLICFFSIPLISYGFGIYGNMRNNLGKSYIINELVPTEHFKSSGINPNHYLTYLYFSSPLANLQNTIDHGTGFKNNGALRDFVFYCILPQSLTLRMEKELKLSPPDFNLVHPHLVVGSFLLLSYSTLGWLGMILTFLFLILYIIVCIVVIRRWDTFILTTYSILVTTISLLTFSNFLNRLDVILTLFVYPVIFHFIFKLANSELSIRKLN